MFVLTPFRSLLITFVYGWKDLTAKTDVLGVQFNNNLVNTVLLEDVHLSKMVSKLIVIIYWLTTV